jgi:hypothetical protein
MSISGAMLDEVRERWATLSRAAMTVASQQAPMLGLARTKTETRRRRVLVLCALAPPGVGRTTHRRRLLASRMAGSPLARLTRSEQPPVRSLR